MADLIQSQSDERWKHIVSALTVAYCFYALKLSHPKLDKFAIPVLRLLELNSDVEKRECPEYPVVCCAMPDQQ